MKAGKALDERKGEIKIHFNAPPSSSFLFDQRIVPANELTIELQPNQVFSLFFIFSFPQYLLSLFFRVYTLGSM